MRSFFKLSLSDTCKLFLWLPEKLTVLPLPCS